MSQVDQLHEQAMDAADQAFIARRQGDTELAQAMAREALDLETRAADSLPLDPVVEPTRSVLYRSAASLAIDCSDSRAAERLVAKALSGYPPDDIRAELLDLLEQVNFLRHLELREVALAANELQFAIAGDVVGSGIALSSAFIERVKDFERLMYRTVERKLGIPFRELASAARSIIQAYSLFLGAPRPGSFSVTLRLGHQMSLPELDVSQQVISELFDDFSLLNEAKDTELRARIGDEAYYHNFVGLAKRIAPDGENVRTVALTTQKEGREIHVALTRPQASMVRAIQPPKLYRAERHVKVTGRLKFADATRTKGRIQLIDKSNRAHTILVPEGMMNDIVRPLWDDTVTVKGIRKGQSIVLQDIDQASETK